jgi:hypothetical protein
MREAVLPSDEDDIPSKKTKVDDTYRRKAEELEKRLETLQKQKIPHRYPGTFRWYDSGEANKSEIRRIMNREESILFAKKYVEDVLSFFGLNTDVSPAPTFARLCMLDAVRALP